MLKNVVSVSLIVVSALAMAGCESKDVRACKKLAHQQIEEVCDAAKEELKKYSGTEEYAAMESLVKSVYPVVCFDDELMKQAIEKVDLACESDPSVATRK